MRNCRIQLALVVTLAAPPGAGALLAAPPQSAKPADSKTVARGKTEPAGPPRKRMVVDLSGFEMLDAEKLKQQRTQVGATRGAAKPVALAPYRARLFGIAPRLAWSYAGAEKQFKLLVRDAEGTVVYRAQVSSTELAYPSTVPPLAPGKTYSWTVEVSPTPRAPEPSDPLEFTFVGGKERTAIEAALKKLGTKRDYATVLARAKLFTEHRLWYDAIGEYCALLAQFPDRPELYEQRGMIYAQIDATKALADADFARADKLRSGPRPGN